MTTSSRITRRAALKGLAAAGLSVPFVFRHHVHAKPIETLNHASFGASGMALADLRSLSGSRNLRVVAIADVDETRAAEARRLFPDARFYPDWRQLLDRERDLHSANISTPDNMHAPITMRAMQQGLHVYTQKPLTQAEAAPDEQLSPRRVLHAPLASHVPLQPSSSRDLTVLH